MNYKFVIFGTAFVSTFVYGLTNAICGVSFFYVMVGTFFVVLSPSRGPVADFLFGVFWPLYVYSDWRSGQL